MRDNIIRRRVAGGAHVVNLERFRSQCTMTCSSLRHETVFRRFARMGDGRVRRRKPPGGRGDRAVPHVRLVCPQVAPAPLDHGLAGSLALPRRSGPAAGRSGPGHASGLRGPATRCHAGGIARPLGRPLAPPPRAARRSGRRCKRWTCGVKKKSVCATERATERVKGLSGSLVERGRDAVQVRGRNQREPGVCPPLRPGRWRVARGPGHAAA